MSRRAKIAFSAAESAFIQERRLMPRAEIHAAFVSAFDRHDVAVDHIKSLCTRRGWTTRERWTPEEDAALSAAFADTPTAKLAEQLGRPLASTYNRAHRLGLKKSAAYLESPAACRLRRGDNVGAAYRFKKGQTPMNKGVKHPPGWAPGRMRETQFKAGERSYNAHAVGSERVIYGYRYTKVSEHRNVPWTKNWEPTHRLNWERVNGKVPEAHCLKSLDGDRLNVEASNWTCIPRSMLPLLSGGPHGGANYDHVPDAVKPTVMAVAKLKYTAKNLKGRSTSHATAQRP